MQYHLTLQTEPQLIIACNFSKAVGHAKMIGPGEQDRDFRDPECEQLRGPKCYRAHHSIFKLGERMLNKEGEMPSLCQDLLRCDVVTRTHYSHSSPDTRMPLDWFITGMILCSLILA